MTKTPIPIGKVSLATRQIFFVGYQAGDDFLPSAFHAYQILGNKYGPISAVTSSYLGNIIFPNRRMFYGGYCINGDYW
jgi:hypothetical protein